jgi:hypothetical protein
MRKTYFANMRVAMRKVAPGDTALTGDLELSKASGVLMRRRIQRVGRKPNMKFDG